jgi:hypothetical protein
VYLLGDAPDLRDLQSRFEPRPCRSASFAVMCSLDLQMGTEGLRQTGRTPLPQILWSRERGLMTESTKRERTKMASPTIDARGSGNSGGTIPLLRIVKTTRMERFSWLVMGVIVLATGVIFLTDKTQRGSIVESVLLWVLVLSGLKMTIIGAVGRYPLPRWFNALVPNRPE